MPIINNFSFYLYFYLYCFIILVLLLLLLWLFLKLYRARQGLEKRVLERTARLTELNEKYKQEIRERKRAEEEREPLISAIEQAAERSDIAVVICTGFSEKINKEQARENGVNGFIMKPVTRSDLAKMVRNVLDEAKSENREESF